MFRASSCPSLGAYQLQQQPLVLPSECGDSSAVGRGRSVTDRPRPTALLPPRSNGEPKAAAAAAVDRLLMMGKRMPETS